MSWKGSMAEVETSRQAPLQSVFSLRVCIVGGKDREHEGEEAGEGMVEMKVRSRMPVMAAWWVRWGLRG